MTYDIHEHKHRFAAWAASLATQRGISLTTRQGQKIFEISGIQQLISSPRNLPNPAKIDSTHRDWRKKVICAATDKEVSKIAKIPGNVLNLSHGQAAKLINVYFKNAFVCGGHDDDPKVQALHPPVDRILLQALAKKDKIKASEHWKHMKTRNWTQFDCEDYENIIGAIRDYLGKGVALWQIEKFWSVDSK